MIDAAVSKLAVYALRTGLIEESEYLWAVNTILDTLKLDSYTDPGQEWGEIELATVLEELLDDAYARGVLTENSVVYRDLFDTELMGRLTPRPAQVISKFQALYREAPQKATDWYYELSQDTNYIRRDRIAKDMQWKTDTEYGQLDITINLSKPEKDPKAIAAARDLPASNYPRCQLCAENEGYAGRVNHPARQNHRIIPITIHDSRWFLQYSTGPALKSCWTSSGSSPTTSWAPTPTCPLWAALSWRMTTSRVGAIPLLWRRHPWKRPSPSRVLRM